LKEVKYEKISSKNIRDFFASKIKLLEEKSQYHPNASNPDFNVYMVHHTFSF